MGLLPVNRGQFVARMKELGFQSIVEDVVVEHWEDVPDDHSIELWHKVRPCCRQTALYPLDHGFYASDVLARVLDRVEHDEHDHGCG